MKQSRNCDQSRQSLGAVGDKADDTDIAEHFEAAGNIDNCVADGDHIVAAQGIAAVVAVASTPDSKIVVSL